MSLNILVLSFLFWGSAAGFGWSQSNSNSFGLNNAGFGSSGINRPPNFGFQSNENPKFGEASSGVSPNREKGIYRENDFFQNHKKFKSPTGQGNFKQENIWSSTNGKPIRNDFSFSSSSSSFNYNGNSKNSGKDLNSGLSRPLIADNQNRETVNENESLEFSARPFKIFHKGKTTSAVSTEKTWKKISNANGDDKSDAYSYLYGKEERPKKVYNNYEDSNSVEGNLEKPWEKTTNEDYSDYSQEEKIKKNYKNSNKEDWKLQDFKKNDFKKAESGSKWNTASNSKKTWSPKITKSPVIGFTTTRFSTTTEKAFKGENSGADAHAILDELDKNDWYFGKESDFPEVNANFKLNIDLGELWDFDKRRGIPNKKSKGNNNSRRRNREIKGDFPCECVDVNLCDEEDALLIKFLRCKKLTDVCCTKPKYEHNFIWDTHEEFSRPLSCGQRMLLSKQEKNDSSSSSEDDLKKVEDFPWLLTLETAEEDINCVASLIHPRLALTVAHCIQSMGPSDLFARGGIPFNEDSFQIRKVAQIIMHPNYDEKHLRNDVGLLVLDRPFVMNAMINTVCLPFGGGQWNEKDCAVAGWSSDRYNWMKFKKINVELLPQAQCQQLMMTRDFQNYFFDENFICGREDDLTNPRTCGEMSGNPIVCPSTNLLDTYVQIGMVSKATSCQDSGEPVIYTNLMKFVDWANEMALDLGLFDYARLKYLN